MSSPLNNYFLSFSLLISQVFSPLASSYLLLLFFCDLLLIFLFFWHVFIFLVSRRQCNIHYERYTHTAMMVGTVFNGKYCMI